MQSLFNKDFAMDPPLSLIGENGKEGMEDSTEKEGNPRSLMYFERSFDPSKPCAHLKQNQSYVDDAQNQDNRDAADLHFLSSMG